MAYDIRINGDTALLVLSAEIDLQTTSDMKNDIVAIAGITQLDIDASDVTYIDSSGIAVLLLARQHCLQNNITINFTAASSAIYRVLQMAKLDTILPIAQIVDHGDDTGFLGIASDHTRSKSPSQIANVPSEQEEDDPLMQALLQEVESTIDDEFSNTQPLAAEAIEPDSHQSALAESTASIFGEAVPNEAFTSAMLADGENHEEELKTTPQLADGESADNPDPLGQADVPDVSTIKPGSFSYE